MTHSATMKNRAVGEHRPLLALDQLHQLPFDLFGILLVRRVCQSPSPGKSPQVRINGDTWDAKRIPQHYICRLSAYPRQHCEVFDCVRNLPPKLLLNNLAQPYQRPGFA